MVKDTGKGADKSHATSAGSTHGRGAQGEIGRTLHVGADVGDASFDRDTADRQSGGPDTAYGLGRSYAAGHQQETTAERERSSQPAADSSNTLGEGTHDMRGSSHGPHYGSGNSSAWDTAYGGGSAISPTAKASSNHRVRDTGTGESSPVKGSRGKKSGTGPAKD